MKKMLLLMAMVFSLSSMALDPLNGSSQLPKSIKFENGNFFAITSQFNQNLLDNFAEKLLNYDKKKMFIYFDTPGGSVIALSQMARIMKSSGVNFTCIANFAASAGFMLFQHCDTRIVMSDGILMSHNWAGGFSGEGPRILTLYNAIQSLIDRLEAIAIGKMNVDKKEYLALINNNLWMPSSLALKYGAIDGILDYVTCSKQLMNKRVPVFYRRANFFRGSIIYKSGCPLIQKTYSKKSNNNESYFEVRNETLFEMAQKGYKLESANWFYSGTKLLK